MFSDFLSRSFLFTFFYIYWKCSFLSSSSSSSLSFVAGASTMLLLLFFVTSYLIRSLALCAFFLSLDFSFFFVRHLRVSVFIRSKTCKNEYETNTVHNNDMRKKYIQKNCKVINLLVVDCAKKGCSSFYSVLDLLS